MSKQQAFLESVQAGYNFKGPKVKIGRAKLENTVVPDADVYLPLKMLNRHGLIAGATGTGKTKTLQLISEYLSSEGIPVLVMDIKGDLSGIAVPGSTNDKIKERSELIGIPFEPSGFPVELLTLSPKQMGVRLRATVSEFGPILFSKILGLNDIQGGLVAMLFKYSDDNDMPLLDIKDFKSLLRYASEDGKEAIEREYGKISTVSLSTIQRKIIELEQQGGESFFGEVSFEVDDLMQTDAEGQGVISVLRVMDLQDKPKLFSTFMLQLLAELYSTCPEIGDADKPKLVLFIDEAHLIFQEASKPLLQQIETTIKLIRSKGIGIFFCTQNPMDVPAAILGQLGMKVQHALRAFTAADRKVIKQTAENYPLSDYYKTDELLTQVGVGEALFTCLNEKGVPTPLVHVMLSAPRSRMDVLTDGEVYDLVKRSKLAAKYNAEVDNRSAHEMLQERMNRAKEEAAQQQTQKTTTQSGRPQPSMMEQVLDNAVVKSSLRTAATMITRSLLGTLLGGKKR
ncbi:MAG TPA: helicase HerA-like domain-containing protein [Phnomibacter sp.]|nr:helicase HerA-like domain-containing protein [Phnomibacter sp.]